jgi:hypothetical protein
MVAPQRTLAEGEVRLSSAEESFIVEERAP